MQHQTGIIVALLAYLTATALLLRSPANTRGSVAFTLLGLAAHGLTLSVHWFGASPDVNVLQIFSTCAWVTVAVLCLARWFDPAIFQAGIVILPITAGILLFHQWLPVDPIRLNNPSPSSKFHILSSITAFGLLSIAGVFALFAAIADYLLRQHRFGGLLQAMPPLQLSERLLFSLNSIGFVLLSIGLVSGVMFIDNLFAQHLVHKTTLTLAAWVVYAVLLWGGWRHGWRGKRAVRLTLIGISLLLLAYFGSKLALEVVLERSWQLE